MTDPDRAPKPVEEAAAIAAKQIARVWQLAHAQGVRDGIDIAAKICDSVSITTRNKPEGVSDQDIASVATSDFLRDKLREFALDIDDPPPIPFDEEEEES